MPSFLPRTALPLAPLYRGLTTARADFSPVARVREVADGRITLVSPILPSLRPMAGDDLWLVNVGVGDRFELPAIIDLER